MKYYTFMSRPGYKKIIQDYQEGLKKIDGQIKMQVKDEKVKKDVESLTTHVFEEVSKFVKTEKTRLSDEMEQLRGSYKQARSTYSDPVQELLRRQDFDLEVATLSSADIKQLLTDKERELSPYELRKLSTLEGVTEESKIVVQRLLKESRYPYESDPKYRKLNRSLSELELIDKPVKKEVLLYLPSEDGPITSVSLSSASMFYDRADIMRSEFNKVQSGITVLAELPEGSITLKEKNTLEKTVEKTVALSREKKLVYDDFDRHAIRGTPEFTIEDRFMYLRERYDDETSDRFDLSKDGYNINQHYDYLETKHNEKLASDPEFKEQYEAAGQTSEA